MFNCAVVLVRAGFICDSLYTALRQYVVVVVVVVVVAVVVS